MADNAKAKIESYIQDKNVNLSVIFRVIDANSSGEIDFAEFKTRVRALHMPLAEEEIVAIFKSMDKDNSNTISYAELCEQFAQINTQQILNKLKKLFTAGNINPEYHFNKYSAQDGSRTSMSKSEFERMIKEVNNEVTALETTHVFKHFDTAGKGYIRLEEFTKAFDKKVVKQGFNLSIEDIIKPLATKAKKFNIKFEKMFEAYDKNNNNMLDVNELTHALKKNNLITTKDDKNVLERYLKDHYNSEEITLAEFKHMLSKFTRNPQERKFVEADAKRALYEVRNRM